MIGLIELTCEKMGVNVKELIRIKLIAIVIINKDSRIIAIVINK